MTRNDLMLLGIKYEAARVGGLDGDALTGIEREVMAAAGDGWQTDPAVLRGRNAVRAEHGLARVGEAPREGEPPVPRRSLLRRVLGR